MHRRFPIISHFIQSVFPKPQIQDVKRMFGMSGERGGVSPLIPRKAILRY